MLKSRDRVSLPESIARRIEDAEALDAIADKLRASAHDKLVDPPAVHAFFNGDWLGHRVHPISAQAPIGAWSMAVLLDLIGSEKHAAAVDTLLLTGCLAALPTAIAGAHDLATTSGRETRVAVVHALVMDVTLGLFTAAWLKRRRGDKKAARRLAVGGAVMAGAGAYLGGHLVYRLGVGVGEP
ncbi:DUF2231 domain-containing protein [Nocardioides sp.]|uniref:DUF2231 domain-containing protein n=1 Tax=Nocardioides sp. TaxID=35761 RepID=UPI002BEB4681|nr:DUF2231 domain-containing protein [Nocardioides sp.]HXH80333.1 DUF2231 domain-containing protein [Nocardioides sp.]